jgi:hypothetical protein
VLIGPPFNGLLLRPSAQGAVHRARLDRSPVAQRSPGGRTQARSDSGYSPSSSDCVRAPERASRPFPDNVNAAPNDSEILPGTTDSTRPMPMEMRVSSITLASDSALRAARMKTPTRRACSESLSTSCQPSPRNVSRTPMTSPGQTSPTLSAAAPMCVIDDFRIAAECLDSRPDRLSEPHTMSPDATTLIVAETTLNPSYPCLPDSVFNPTPHVVQAVEGHPTP